MSKIIAHRGLNRKAPENTLPAFLKAVEANVDGIETDVHLTLDGKLVICHNYDIDRTSNGTGMVSDMTFEELRKYDFRHGYGDEFKDTKIPLLEEVLDIVKDLEIINIEIKSPLNKKFDIVKKTIDMVKDFSLTEKTIISSFDHNLLICAKEIDQKIKTGMLYSVSHENIERIASDYIGYAKLVGVDALHPLVGFVEDEEYIETAHKNNITVNPWTVDKEYQIKTLNDWNCDGIITNIADEALNIINERKKAIT